MDSCSPNHHGRYPFPCTFPEHSTFRSSCLGGAGTISVTATKEVHRLKEELTQKDTEIADLKQEKYNAEASAPAAAAETSRHTDQLKELIAVKDQEIAQLQEVATAHDNTFNDEASREIQRLEGNDCS